MAFKRPGNVLKDHPSVKQFTGISYVHNFTIKPKISFPAKPYTMRKPSYLQFLLWFHMIKTIALIKIVPGCPIKKFISLKCMCTCVIVHVYEIH